MTEKAVIVGHGPSIIGAKKGRSIDSMPVVRMHTCHRHKPVSDFGLRYDYGILGGSWAKYASDEIEKIPETGWLYYVLPGCKQEFDSMANRPVTAYSEEIGFYFGDMCIKRKPPTRGLCAILMTILHLKPKELWLAGFDSIITGTVTQYHNEFDTEHPRIEGKYIGKSFNRAHEFDIEHSKMKTIARDTGTLVYDIITGNRVA